jgi:hypothetical protein
MDMWFLNKETGLTWDVSDQELIQRLQANANYEIVEEAKQDAKNTKRNEKDTSA